MALERDYPGKLPGDFLVTLSQATRESFCESLLPVPGVEAVLKWLLREGHRFCVASNGALSKIHHSLNVTGLMAYFGEHCYSAESVRAGKPEPDLFLHAAERMGVTPNQAVVVEDSAAGIAAALSAGMRVCVFGAVSVLDEGAIHRFQHMTQLPELLTKLFGQVRIGRSNNSDG